MGENLKRGNPTQPEPRVAERPCPVCAARLTATSVTDTEQAPPKPGDVTICVFCATPLAFGSGLDLRVISEAEVAALDGDEGAATGMPWTSCVSSKGAMHTDGYVAFWRSPHLPL